MNVRTVIGRSLTVFVTVGLAASVYAVMQLGACVENLTPCPAYGGVIGVALPALIVLAFLAMLLGSIEMFPGIFLGIGIGALAAVPGSTPADRSFPLTFGLAFTFAGLLPVWFVMSGRRRVVEAARLAEVGLPAVGTILAVQDTGTTINDDPQVELTVRIELRHLATPPFTATKTITMSRVRPIRVGERFPVLVDPSDSAKWAMVTAITDTVLAPEEIRELWLELQGPHPTPTDAVVEATVAHAPSTTAAPDPVERLTQLDELHRSGGLTADEYSAAKALVLAGQTDEEATTPTD